MRAYYCCYDDCQKQDHIQGTFQKLHIPDPTGKHMTNGSNKSFGVPCLLAPACHQLVYQQNGILAYPELIMSGWPNCGL